MLARPWLAITLAFLLSLMTTVQAVAQDATPPADRNAPLGDRETSAEAGVPRLDLAAMVLASDDLPEGFRLTFEAYLSGAQVASQLLGGAVPVEDLEATGLVWYYESQYQSLDGQSRIRSYVEEYGSNRGARLGFDILENEDNFAGPGVSYVDEPGLGVGQEPSEVTVSTVQSSEGNPSGASIDFTFRVGRLLAGVAVDTVSTTPPDEELLRELAERLAERIQAVLDGETIVGIDASLATGLVGFEEVLDIQEGYLSVTDAFGNASPEAALASYESGYVHAVALGAEANPDLPLPLVSITIAAFDAESGPLSVLSAAEDVTPAFTGLARDDLDRIPGATAAVALGFVSPLTNGEADSIRLFAVVAERLYIVEVQGAASLDEARAVALALIGQQIDCGVGPCPVAVLPDGFVPSPSA